MTTEDPGAPGALRRIAGQTVPLAVGLVTGQLLAPHAVAALGGGWGLWAVSAFVGTLVGWAVAAALLRVVRRRPRLLALYRLLLLAHVVFWSARGLGTGAPEGPGPVRVGEARSSGAARPLLAGVGEARFDLPPSTPLGGWGQAPRRRAAPAFGGLGVVGRISLGLAAAPAPGSPPRAPLFTTPDGEGEALGARALLLRPGDADVLLGVVRLDLVVPDATVTARILERTRALGLDEATLLVAATHTHSGPGGYQAAPLAQVAGTGLRDPAIVDAIVDAAVRALERAHGDLRPARLAFVDLLDRGEDGRPVLARNRRGEADDVETRVPAIRIDEPEGGRARAVLLAAAVHPTMVRRRHLRFHRDLAGALEDELSARLPGAPLVLFVNGALGDVAPRRVEGGPGDLPPERALARAFAERVAPALAAAPSLPRLRIRAARAERDLGTPYAIVAAGSRRTFADRVVPDPVGDDAPAVLANVLALPANVLLWSLTLTELRAGFSFDGAAGVLVRLDRMLPARDHAVGAVLLAASDEAGAETSRLLLWTGGEASTALGRRWRRRVADATGVAPVLLGLVNDPLAYLVTETEYDHGGYEADATLFGPTSGRTVGDALVEAAAVAATDG